MIWILKFIAIAVSVCITDICWAKYMVYVNDKKAIKAGVWSSLIVLCGSLSFFGYMEDRRFVAAAIIGAFAGTYLTVKKSKNG